MLWGEKGFLEVCDTVKFLINELKEIKPEIKTKKININDFDYEKNNGCEIIP